MYQTKLLVFCRNKTEKLSPKPFSITLLSHLTFSQLTILDAFKLKEIADDNFKFDVNGRKFSNTVEKAARRRNCSLQAISPFPTVFSNDLYCRNVKTRVCMGNG